MQDVETILQLIKAANTFDDAMDVFDEFIKSHGYDAYLFSQMSVIDSPSIYSVEYYKTTYPPEWSGHYVANNYMLIDPIAIELMSNNAPFYWSQLIQEKGQLTEEANAMMAHAMDYDLVDGAGVSYLRNKGYLYAISISRKGPISSYDLDFLSKIYFIGAVLVDLYEQSHMRDGKDIVMSDREKNVITYAAIGKTDAEIACIMDLSVNTIRYHWKNIFNKLESYNRVFAIIRAANLGLVNLEKCDITTRDGSVIKRQASV